ncbi:MAG: DUF4912 domain-containing protein [Firmicutes bacterium]|nr:DUF4912 domain-containing protein [Bacillota bacterium]
MPTTPGGRACLWNGREGGRTTHGQSRGLPAALFVGYLNAEGELLKPPTSKRQNRELPCETSTPSPVKDLPTGYGKDYIVLMAKDPTWLFTYWEITPCGWNRCSNNLNAHECQLVLRIIQIALEENSKHKGVLGFFDISVPPFTSDWHINTGKVGGLFQAIIGIHTPLGDFRPIASSNKVQAPWGRSPFTSPWHRELPLLEFTSTPPPDPGTSPMHW